MLIKQLAAQAVEELLQVLGQEGHQQVSCPSWHYQDHDEQAQSSDISRQLPLQEALVKCYDLRSFSATSAPGNQQKLLGRVLLVFSLSAMLVRESRHVCSHPQHRVRQEHKTCC